MQRVTANHHISAGVIASQYDVWFPHSSDSSDTWMPDVSDNGHDESLEDEHRPSDEEDDRMSVDEDEEMSIDEEGEVSEDEDDETSDDEDDEDEDEDDEENEDSDDKDDRLPQEKCGLSDYQYGELLKDEHDGLLEESFELQDEKAGAILDREATEAAWPTCCKYLTDATTKLGPTQKLLIAEHSAQYHSPTGHATKVEIDAFHAARCMNVRAKYCRLVFQHMQRGPPSGPLPIEVRRMVYKYIFEDSHVNIDEEGAAEGRYPGSYNHLLQFKMYTADAGVREELTAAWYRATTHHTTDPSTLASSLSRFYWRRGLDPSSLIQQNLKPLELIRHVQVDIPVGIDRDIAQETLILGKLNSLYQLKKGTTITIAPEVPLGYSCFAEFYLYLGGRYVQNLEYLFAPLARVRTKGYMVIVRAGQGLRFVVEPEECNVEGWRKGIRAAINEAWNSRA